MENDWEIKEYDNDTEYLPLPDGSYEATLVGVKPIEISAHPQAKVQGMVQRLMLTFGYIDGVELKEGERCSISRLLNPTLSPKGKFVPFIKSMSPKGSWKPAFEKSGGGADLKQHVMNLIGLKFLITSENKGGKFNTALSAVCLPGQTYPGPGKVVKKESESVEPTSLEDDDIPF